MEKPDEMRHIFAAVRSNTSDKRRISWVLYGHTNNDDAEHLGLKLIAKDICPRARLEDFVNQLEDSAVMYGLVRMSSMVAEMLTVKFVYIRW